MEVIVWRYPLRLRGGAARRGTFTGELSAVTGARQ